MFTPVLIRMLPTSLVVPQLISFLREKSLLGAIGKPKTAVSGFFCYFISFLIGVILILSENAFSEVGQAAGGEAPAMARFSGHIPHEGFGDARAAGGQHLVADPLKSDISFLESSKFKLQELYASASAVIGKSSKEFIRYADRKYGSLDLRFEGVENLRRDELEALIPAGQSYYWWWSNQNLIIATLKQHPLIEDVAFESCEGEELLRCFVLRIKERIPALWVKADWESATETRFLIADDGAVLSILNTDKKMEAVSRFDRKLLARFSSETLTGLPVLDARNLANISDASQQLFNRAVKLVSIIEKESHAQVYELRFLGDHEVEVEFDSQPFKVIFNIEASDALESRIGAQVLRLDKILSTTPQLSSRALSINLGLEKEAFAVLSKGDSKTKGALGALQPKKI